MAADKGPLSPHLQIYKWQVPMLMSIVHRGAGIFLSIAALLLAYWLLAISAGPATYAKVLVHIHAWYGTSFLIASVFSLYYHLCNGIRHLFWDAGLGFEIKTAYRSGYTVIVISLLLTIATCALGIGAG